MYKRYYSIILLTYREPQRYLQGSWLWCAWISLLECRH